MFDYIHTDIKDKTVSEILSNPLLDFISPVSTSTGEINPFNRERNKSKYPPKVQQKADLNSMTISVTNGTHINLQGSIHEFFHDNNSGDFTFSEVKKAIENICSALNIDSGLTPLHNLEFGVNIVLPFPVVTFAVIITQVLTSSPCPKFTDSFHEIFASARLVVSFYIVLIYNRNCLNRSSLSSGPVSNNKPFTLNFDSRFLKLFRGLLSQFLHFFPSAP